MTQDQGFTNDLQKSINKWMKRKETEVKRNAKSVTDTEETVCQAVMEASIHPHDSEEWKQAVKEVLQEMEQETTGKN